MDFERLLHGFLQQNRQAWLGLNQIEQGCGYKGILYSYVWIVTLQVSTASPQKGKSARKHMGPGLGFRILKA